MIKARWNTLDTARATLLDRARDCASLTLPHLLPPLGHTEDMRLPIPWQAHGATCVRNLAGRLALTLFPPNLPFFRFGLAEYLKASDPELRDTWDMIRDGHRILEKSVTTFFDTHGWRIATVDAAESLITVGNVLLHRDEFDRMRTIRYDHYVVKRDAMGEPFEIIVKETKCFATLASDVQALVLPELKRQGNDPDDRFPIDIYTHVYLNKADNHWYQRQEVFDVPWPGGEGHWPTSDCPWIPLRFTALGNEDYGRGLVELTLGDWRSLESFYIDLAEIAAAMAKIIPLVNPSGLTSIRDITRAGSGVPIPGRADDITFVNISKLGDVQFMLAMSERIEQRLGRAFLLNSSIQRQGERVTAEEIKFMAKELENAFGGTYTLLAEDWQLKVVNLALASLRRDSRFPKVNPQLRPQVITGIAGLGKDTEMASIDEFSSRLQLLDPQQRKVKTEAVLRKTADAAGLIPSDVVKTDVELADELEQAQQAEQAKTLSPEVVKGLMNPQNPLNKGALNE